MIRLLHGLSVLTLLAAGSILTLCVRQWSCAKAAPEPGWDRPGAVETFLQNAHGARAEEKELTSPLMAAANSFAAYLNPPAPVRTPPAPPQTPKPVSAAPVVRPPTVTARFKLCGTSCCDDQPQRSMALILEPGSREAAHWVRRGTQVGHFIIQEIRSGSVVYLDGQQVREMVIEREVAAATAAVEKKGSIDSRPAPAAKAETARRPAAITRPAPSKSMTVGSPRTAALD